MSDNDTFKQLSLDGVLLADGLDEAFSGVGRRCGQQDVAVYSIRKAIQVLVGKGATEEEAREYLEFNSIGAWVGQLTPMWLEEMTLSEFFNLFPIQEGPLKQEDTVYAEGESEWEDGEASVH